jgi:ankyrin repeat protein
LKLAQLEDVWCFFSGAWYSEECHVIQEAFEACGILLERGAEGDVNIKHQEVKNFLTQNPSVWGADKYIHPFFFTESDAHCGIAKVSVNYIEQSIFQNDDCNIEIDDKTSQILFSDGDYTAQQPFIQYSARFWPEHAKKATSGGIKFDSSFFSHGNIARRNWFRAAWGFTCHLDCKYCPKFQSRLHVAAFFDLEEWAQHLCSLDGWSRRMEKRNTDFLTQLFVAAARESTRVFAILLDHGAERTIMDENVFHFACRTGSTGIVRLLLERNVDVNETTSAIGLLQCLTSAFRLLPGLSGIVQMRRSSDWKDVLFMLFFGEKTTLLHNAVLGGHEEIVEMLLDHKADVNQATIQNGTAAHIAAWKGTPIMLELLKKHGADFTQHTLTGWYPIHCAAVHGNEAAIQWLLSHGASIDSVTAAGETALHIAAQYGLYHTAKLLLDSNAAVDAKTVENLTSLHIVALSGHDNVVMVLLMYNAD